MKYVVNHWDLFEHYQIPFLVGLMQVSTSIFAEVVTVYMITVKKNVELCIVYFVTLKLIIEIPEYYFEAQENDNKLQKVFETHVFV